MQLWLLSHLIDSPVNAMVLEAAARAGVEMRQVHPSDVGFELTGRHEELLFEAGGGRPDLVLTRTGSSAPPGTLQVVRALERAGVRCINRSAALELSRDKLRTFTALAGAGVPLPPTIALGRGIDLSRAAELLGPPPWIVKLPVSTQGIGVARVDSLASLRSVTDLLHGLDRRVLLQALVGSAFGVDVRVLVLGGVARHAMRRQSATPEEFRSNLHRGGKAERIELTPELAGVAERAAGALGVEIAGVDLLPGESGPLVIEVNGSPGLRGMARVSGTGVADEVLEFLLQAIA